MKKLFLLFLALNFSLFAKEVTVSILPQKYFVEKIAKDKISVNVMVQPGFSPATYEPKTSQMRKLANSKVYFSIGVPFEKAWLEKFKNANKNLLVVDTTEGIEKLPMAKHSHEEEHDEHKHDEHNHNSDHKHEQDHEDEHEHEGLDPHVWLDPILVKIQAKNIYKTLVKIDEANSEFYQTNYENFIKELDSLYLQLKEILTPVKDRAFMVFHPSWGYFAKRFTLEQIAVEVQGKEPKPNQLVELINEAKEHNIKIVFVAPQFSQKSAKVIANSIKGDAVIMDPLVENWKEGLIKTSKQIVDSYK
ncbi:cation ABC transporter substrate-binding protein [Malaciobacter mytili LMG 24559]|uniref:Cation ABC transporter substrate-binding protein n=1 Tax=Malaciobacter mytili LMG 24559 TaxID=1032238 RepID=A0AAX2AHR1_9BACT|nr:zinc ABC transporter substrate-binding protein [Malaciobacter mytili]AXH14332.1 metal ion ABC transporter, periplasmic metal-binding protein [Malaciobacter mytili LMG 24559]RXK16554.1 cation ABC transporter substrate-binding protein [Malaciobacter mytili LMG 24559]